MEELIKAFELTLRPCKEDIDRGTALITSASRKEGYCPTLMQVVAL
jgi:hypothetical protein